MHSTDKKQSAHAASGREGSDGSARSLQMVQARIVQYCRSAVVALIFLASAVCLHVQQWLGAPLYWANRRWYYAWQTKVKELAALLIIGLNQIRAPTTARVSGDASVSGQIRAGQNPLFDFSHRMVLIANHQIYTDWIFFWWTAYNAGHHGHLFVILKDSLKKIPVIGPGLTFFSWIFLSRKWEADQMHFQQGIQHLAEVRARDPMWLMIFPEGTNMSRNARKASERWSNRSGIADLRHALLPRSRGLHFCLQGLADSIEWVYDCTIAYEGIPLGEYGQEVYSLRRLYVDGAKAPAAHMHWRRFAIKDIPVHDPKAFEDWTLRLWVEKDELLDYFQQRGSFPAGDGHIVAEIKVRNPLEALGILVGPAAAFVMWRTCKLLISRIAGVE